MCANGPASRSGSVPGSAASWTRASRKPSPRWPDPRFPQQLHLDIRVDDVEAAEAAVLALGARRLPAESEDGFRVYIDPVGHPFRLVFG